VLGISFGELREVVDSVEIGDAVVYRILAHAKRVAAGEYLLPNGVHTKPSPLLTWGGKTDLSSSDGLLYIS
jgi:hypothetical protein